MTTTKQVGIGWTGYAEGERNPVWRAIFSLRREAAKPPVDSNTNDCSLDHRTRLLPRAKYALFLLCGNSLVTFAQAQLSKVSQGVLLSTLVISRHVAFHQVRAEGRARRAAARSRGGRRELQGRRERVAGGGDVRQLSAVCGPLSRDWHGRSHQARRAFEGE